MIRRVALYKYLRYQWFNLPVLLEATSTTHLTLHLCHRCVLIRVASYLTIIYSTSHAALHVHRIEIPYQPFPERVRYEFYCLKAMITLEQLITSVVEKKKISLRKASRFTGKPVADWGSRIEDGGLGIKDQLKKHENLIKKSWIVAMRGADCR